MHVCGLKLQEETELVKHYHHHKPHPSLLPNLHEVKLLQNTSKQRKSYYSYFKAVLRLAASIPTQRSYNMYSRWHYSYFAGSKHRINDNIKIFLSW